MVPSEYDTVDKVPKKRKLSLYTRGLEMGRIQKEERRNIDNVNVSKAECF